MTRFKSLLCAFLAIFWIAGSSTSQVTQDWAVTYSGGNRDIINDIAADPAGNVYVTGYSNNQAATIKYNTQGVQQWTAIHSGYSGANAIAIDNSYVYITGYASTDFITIKYDSAGNQQWEAIYEGLNPNSSNEAEAIAVDHEGNVYVVGTSGISGGANITTIKYSSNGTQEWVAQHNGPSTSGDGTTDLCIDDDGNVYVTGSSYHSWTTQHHDYTTIKYNTNGLQLWASNFENPYVTSYAKAVAVDNNGNVYVTGVSFPSPTQYNWDYATVKYNQVGEQQWVSWYNGPGGGDDIPVALEVDRYGNIIVTGKSAISASNPSMTDIATIKYNTNGIQQWVQRYNGPTNWVDYPNDMILDYDGNIYVTGISATSGLNAKCFTIKYNPSGGTIWQISYNGQFSYGNAAAIDNYGHVLIGGDIGSEFFEDYLTIKYLQPFPNIQIELSPLAMPIQIPASGGSFSFNVTATNGGNAPGTRDIWCDITLPSGIHYGPTIGPFSTYFPVNFSASRLRTQNVPGTAPPGNYTYHGYVGIFPCIICDQDSFPFTKLSTGLGPLVSSWACTGDPFPGQNVASGEIHPSSFSLHSCSPNPFNYETKISFALPQAAIVNLAVYDLSGRKVADLIQGWENAGNREATFNAAHLSSGIYFCRLQVDGFTETRKLILLK